MLLLLCRQPSENRCIACSSSSRRYALTTGNENTSADPSLSYRPYYLSYSSLDVCHLYWLYRHYHQDHCFQRFLQWAERLERTHALSGLQLLFPWGRWRSQRAWRSSWWFCPSWAPGRLATCCSLGYHKGGTRRAPANSSGRLSLQCLYRHQCQWSMAQCRDCNAWLSDLSAMRSCRHLHIHVAWCSKGRP